MPRPAAARLQDTGPAGLPEAEVGGVGRVGNIQRAAAAAAAPGEALLSGAQGHAGQPREGAGPAPAGPAPARQASAEEGHLSGVHQVEEEADALQREERWEGAAGAGEEGQGEGPRRQSQQEKEDGGVQDSPREETRQEVQVQVQQEAAARQLQRSGLGRLDHRPAGLRSVPLRGGV